MARILVNKHFSNTNEIKETIFDALHGKGEIIISNEVGSEGLYIMNDSGVVVKVTGISSPNTSGTTTPDEYKQYLKDYLETYYWTSAQTINYVQNELSDFSGSDIDEDVVKNIVITETSALSETIKILIDSDSGKSARSIAAEEVAKVVANADADFDTLKEIADWIQNDTTGAAKMANDIEYLKKADSALTQSINTVNTYIDTVSDSVSAFSAHVASAYTTKIEAEEYARVAKEEAISSASAYTDTKIEEVKDLIQNIGGYAHQPLTYDQYTELITNGTIEITDENGETNTIVYDDNTFYAIYE